MRPSYYAGDGHSHWHVKRMMAFHIFSPKVTRPDEKVGLCFFDDASRSIAAAITQFARTGSRGVAPDPR